MITMKELHQILSTTIDAVKAGEFVRKKHSMNYFIDDSDTRHHLTHYLTYSSHFETILKPSYNFYLKQNSKYTPSDEIDLALYSESHMVGMSYLFMNFKTNEYKISMFPKSMDDIEIRTTDAVFKLNDLLVEENYFQLSTIHQLPEYEFLHDFGVMNQQLRGILMKYKYRIKATITDAMCYNNIDKFLEQINLEDGK